MTYVTVLTDEEMALALHIANCRNSRSTQAGDAPAFGAPVNGTALSLVPNVVGATGEVAVAKLLGLYPNLSVYHEEKRSGGYDLPHRICVRSAQKRFGLLVRPTDDSDARYVAAVVAGKQVRLLGWEIGRNAQRDEWLSAPHGRPPCYLVPESQLQRLSALVAVIAAEQVGYAEVLAAREVFA